MATQFGTNGSCGQELTVPVKRNDAFRLSDTVRFGAKLRGMKGYMKDDERAAAAFRRLNELLGDLGYGEDLAPGFIMEILGDPADLTEKAVKMWYQREKVSAYHVFNLAEALGVDAGWLGGSSRISKEKAVDRKGRYFREIERMKQQRMALAPRRTA